MAGERLYNDPIGGTPSTMGAEQFNEWHYQKQALIEARREQYFMPLASVSDMPKHMGKTIKKYHYIPLLDDENLGTQGLDPSGAVIANQNLYGSSKDVGTISGKLPVLGEAGGRVNRVGFKRKQLEGTIEKYGFFDEYSQESVDFDSDAQLKMHVHREMVNGASELTEDMLQIDLLNAAGVVRFGGDATQDSEITGEGATPSLATYDGLMKLAIDLSNNRTPKQTTVITGSRMTDTKVIDGAHVMYIGSELLPMVKKMQDSFGERAFIPVQHYAAGGTVLRGEVGSIDQFRFVVVPEMMHWASAGAPETGANLGYRASGGNYDVFPMLVVGDKSFTTIGFQTNGKTVKFTITHKAPGQDVADFHNPYGELGFMSIKWYYGILILRPERIALYKTVAEI